MCRPIAIRETITELTLSFPVSIYNKYVLLLPELILPTEASSASYPLFFHTVIFESEMEVDSLVGFRFQPTSEEIIRLLKVKRLDPGFSVHTVKEIDFYNFDPWELTSKF